MSQSSPSVLFVTHEASRTGAPIFLLRFLRWFRDQHRFPFRILVVSPGELLPEFGSVGITDVLEQESTLQRLRRFRVPAWKKFRHPDTLWKSLSQSNIGLIYANTIATGRALEQLSFLNCPVICHVHELEQMIRQCDQEGNLALVKKHSSSYVAVSEAVKRNLVANHRIPEQKIAVVHGFVPTTASSPEAWGESRQLVRRELKIPLGARLVCTCGSIEPRKGPDLFLQVADIFVRTYRGHATHFVWIGGRDEQVQVMRKRAQELFRPETIHFIGSRADVGRYYAASDVFLLTSREDPFPLVMMEAALYENPIVCFDHSGGAPEFVQDDAGFAVRAFDAGEMAAKLALLLGSNERRQRMGEAARQKVLQRHNLDISAQRLAAIIQTALNGPRSSEETQRAYAASPAERAAASS